MSYLVRQNAFTPAQWNTIIREEEDLINQRNEIEHMQNIINILLLPDPFENEIVVTTKKHPIIPRVSKALEIKSPK